MALYIARYRTLQNISVCIQNIVLQKNAEMPERTEGYIHSLIEHSLHYQLYVLLD